MKRMEIEKWLNVTYSPGARGDYVHTWCRQAEPGRWQQHLPSIVQYLERAHADARDFFHAALHLSLDPIPTDRNQPSYPHDLPLKAKKGFFGEALCGMLTEAMEIVGGATWTVPAFLFRLHPEAEEHLFRLVMKERVPKDIPGRSGSDFIALSLKDGKLIGIMSGEAKCHACFNVTKCKQFLKDLSAEGPLPVSLPQLIRILEDQDEGDLTELIAILDELLLTHQYEAVPKTHLFLYLFDDPGIAKYNAARINDEIRTASYTSKIPLHVFEVHIPDGTDLVKTAYDRVYREAVADVPA